jgi:fimbrial isopeptide formation D2 family protein
MVVSSFAVVGVSGTGTDECPPGEVIFEKKVWSEQGWVESIEVEPGDTVRFNITMIYNKHEEAPANWYLTNIKITDQLPECLEFDNEVTVTTNSSSPIDYTEEVSGKWIYWNFTEDEPKLYNGNWLSIEFNATVLECSPDEYCNWAYFYGYESCGGYDHDGSDSACVEIVECGEPGIEIDKKVKVGEDWSDEGITEYICIYKLLCEGQYLTFQINVSNTGEVTLHNVIVKDLLPEFLYYRGSDVTPDQVLQDGREIIWDLGDIPVDGYILITFTAWICPSYFLFNDMGEGDNVANATSDETELVEDSVHIIIWKRISVQKDVWDPEAEEWVNELIGVRKGQTVQFRITATYHGPEGSLMDCAVLGDLLANVCLEYEETVLVQVAGQTLEPGTYQYPYIIPDNGDTLLICGQEQNIPEMIQCGQGEYYVIIWDFREAWYFELHDGENITIIFNTNVTQYCECYNYDFAFAIGWGCYLCDPCNYYLDWDCAKVDCSPPETKFDKKVWDGEGWADEGLGIVGKEMVFKLRFEYYGNEDIAAAEFKDVLPCVLEFSEVIESTINITVEVSADGKTIWFNMSEDTIEDGDVVEIIFTAIVTGVSGDCCPDAKNQAWLDVFSCTGAPLGSYYDEVCITTIENHAPCPPIIRDDAEGKVGEELTFFVKTGDPDGDDVYYYINWGDERYEWIGPYTSGDEIEVTHTWDIEGEYTVKAKAKDTWDEEGDWGNEITVTIEEEDTPDLKVCITRGLGRSVSVNIKNNKETPIDDVEWDLTVSKRILGRKLIDDNGTISPLGAGVQETVGGSPFGIGLISIEVKVDAPDIDPIVKTAKGFILFRFVWVT